MNRIQKFLSGIFTRNISNDELLASLGVRSSSDTFAGVSVTGSATSLSTVFACIKVISESIAQLNVHLYDKTDEDNRVKANSHPVYDLLRYAPNPEQTPIEFYSLILSHAVGWGNAYCSIEYDSKGFPKALWPLNPAKMDVKRVGTKLSYLYDNEPIRKDYLYHLRGIGGNSVVGYNIINDLARESVGLSLATERHGATFFGNGARAGLTLSHPSVLSDEAYNRLSNSWNDRHGGVHNSHKVAILEEGVTLNHIGIPPNEAQFLETRQYQVTEICRWFSMQPHMVQDLSHATFSNIEHMAIAFTTHTLGPWIKRLEQSLARDLLLLPERKQFYPEVNINSLLLTDITAKYSGYSRGRNDGWLSVNEIRKKENLPPIEGGDTYLIPLNMTTADRVEVDTKPVEDTGKRSIELRESSESIFQKRLKLATTYVKILEAVFSKIVSREVKDLRALYNKYLVDSDPDLVAFNEGLIKIYERLDPYIEDTVRSTLLSYMIPIADLVNSELDRDDLESDPDFVSAYAENLATAYTTGTYNFLLSVENEELLETLDSIEEKNAEKFATKHSTNFLNAFTVALYGVAGIVTYRWVARGDSCDFCKTLDGKLAAVGSSFFSGGESIKLSSGDEMLVRRKTSYGPLHKGCDCSVEAVQ